MKKLFALSNLPKRVIFTLLIASPVLALTFLFPGESSSANLLRRWTFDSVTYIDSNGGDIPNCDGAGRAFYSNNPDPVRTDLPSPEGGKNIRARISSFTSPQQSQPVFWDSNNWGVSEFYIRFYMYIETDIADGELESIKLFRVNCGNFDSNCPYTINLYGPPANSWHIYHTNASGTWFGSHDGFQQGQWVLYEIYTKYDDPPSADNGILRIWVGGELKWERTNIDFRSDTSYVVDSFGVVYHFKTFGSQIGNIEGHVRIDGVEIWDGMPTAPNPPTNLKVKEMIP